MLTRRTAFVFLFSSPFLMISDASAVSCKESAIELWRRWIGLDPQPGPGTLMTAALERQIELLASKDLVTRTIKLDVELTRTPVAPAIDVTDLLAEAKNAISLHNLGHLRDDLRSRIQQHIARFHSAFEISSDNHQQAVALRPFKQGF